MRGDSLRAHRANHFRYHTDCGGALECRGAGSVLEHGFGEYFPELGEGGTKGSGEAADGVHGGVNGQPVVFRGFVKGEEFGRVGFVAEVFLAWMVLCENLNEGFGDGFESGGVSNEGRA